MNGNITFLLSLTIVFPFLAGLVLFKSIHKSYQPFLIYIMLSFVTEILSYVLIRIYHTNLVLLNVFSLLECILLLTQFYKWRLIRRTGYYYAFIGAVLIAWVTENFLISDIAVTNRIFLISYSFLLVLLSIREINHAMILSNESLYQNPKFIICAGMIIFFTFNIIAQTFRFFGSGFSKDFMRNVFSIVVYTNAITNVIYAFGVYHMQKKNNKSAFFKDF